MPHSISHRSSSFRGFDVQHQFDIVTVESQRRLDSAELCCHEVSAAGDVRILRVASLNVWNSFFVGGPDRKARVRVVLAALKDAALRGEPYDVIFLQEAFTFAVAGRRDGREVRSQNVLQ